MTEKIIDGDFITIDYVGRVKDTNQVFDLTREEVAKEGGIDSQEAVYGPVTVVVGARHVIPGLDKKLTSMGIGEKKKVDIAPEDAFGSRNADFVKLVPRSVFKKDRINPVPGMPVKIGDQHGVVKAVSGGRIKVDFNHPLAGKTLEYEVEVHKKISDPKEQIRSIFKLHIPRVETKDVEVETKGEEVEITTPKDPKTRRYINLTEEITSKDILKYIKGIKRVKFIDVFE